MRFRSLHARWPGFCALLLLCAALAPIASAQTFPSKPVKLVIPFPPGGSLDNVGRLLAQKIGESWGQPVVIENRPGAGGNIGADAVAKSPPDGYTVVMGALSTHAVNPSLYATMPYDAVKDFSPLSLVAITPNVLIVKTGTPIASVRDLVAYAKANPGKLSYASSGPGTSSQQEMEVFKSAAGIDILEVGYKSTAQALTDVLGGHIPLFPVVVPSVLPHLKTGKVKVLGVFDTRRSPLIPDVPAMNEELKMAGYVPTPVWYGFVAPAGTPKDVADALHKLFVGAMDSAEVRERLTGMGAQPSVVTNEQFTADLRAEMDKSAQLAKRLGTAK